SLRSWTKVAEFRVNVVRARHCELLSVFIPCSPKDWQDRRVAFLVYGRATLGGEGRFTISKRADEIACQHGEAAITGHRHHVARGVYLLGADYRRDHARTRIPTIASLLHSGMAARFRRDLGSGRVPVMRCSFRLMRQ